MSYANPIGKVNFGLRKKFKSSELLQDQDMFNLQRRIDRYINSENLFLWTERNDSVDILIIPNSNMQERSAGRARGALATMLTLFEVVAVLAALPLACLQCC